MTTILKSCPFEEPVGKYEIESDKPHEMTNEEWFCGLSTEEKAEVIAEKIRHAQLQYVPTYGTFTNSDWWEKWLKEIHNEV